MNTKVKPMATIVTRLGKDISSNTAIGASPLHGSGETTDSDPDEALETEPDCHQKRYDRLLEKRLREFIEDHNKRKNN